MNGRDQEEKSGGPGPAGSMERSTAAWSPWTLPQISSDELRYFYHMLMPATPGPWPGHDELSSIAVILLGNGSGQAYMEWTRGGRQGQRSVSCHPYEIASLLKARDEPLLFATTPIARPPTAAPSAPPVVPPALSEDALRAAYLRAVAAQDEFEKTVKEMDRLIKLATDRRCASVKTLTPIAYEAITERRREYVSDATLAGGALLAEIVRVGAQAGAPSQKLTKAVLLTLASALKYMFPAVTCDEYVAGNRAALGENVAHFDAMMASLGMAIPTERAVLRLLSSTPYRWRVLVGTPGGSWSLYDASDDEDVIRDAWNRAVGDPKRDPGVVVRKYSMATLEIESPPDAKP